MTNEKNQELLDCKHVDFRSAVTALRDACLFERNQLERLAAVDPSVQDACMIFTRSVDECNEGLQIFEMLYAKFKVELVRALEFKQLYELADAVSADDFKRLGF